MCSKRAHRLSWLAIGADAHYGWSDHLRFPRRTTLACSLVFLIYVTCPLPALGQPVAKVYRIGYMTVVGPGPGRYLLDHAFLPALRERGLVEGKNLTIDWRFAEGHVERLPGFAAELVARGVDLIVAPQSDSALAAMHATHTIPIVHVLAGDPVADGLAASLAHPGGNVTGLTIVPSPEIFSKNLQLLHETTRASRVGVLWNSSRETPTIDLGLHAVRAAAQQLGIQLQFFDARDPDRFEPVFADMAHRRTGAALAVMDSMFWLHRERLAALEAKYRLPTMYGVREHVDAGSLMAYGGDLADLFRRAAGYIAAILKGAKPADLPIEQPTKFELVINLKTAKALGLTVPPSALCLVLMKARRIFS